MDNRISLDIIQGPGRRSSRRISTPAIHVDEAPPRTSRNSHQSNRYSIELPRMGSGGLGAGNSEDSILQVPRRQSRFMRRFSGELPPLPGVVPTSERDLSDYDAYNADTKSARSSMTAHEGLTNEVALAMQVVNVEASIDNYGGQAPEEPNANKTTAPPKEQEDDYVVTWDGPNDPTNPKNWTVKRKYILSFLCCLCTLNVYVPPF